jgi:hypothetical protein
MLMIMLNIFDPTFLVPAWENSVIDFSLYGLPYELDAAWLDAVDIDTLPDDERVRVLCKDMRSAGPPIDAGLREATPLVVLHDEVVDSGGWPPIGLHQQVRPVHQ